MKRVISIVVLSCLCLMGIQAQNDMDAFLFSQSDWEGTARFCGAGGAFGAVGAEYSALATNPASIGVYKKSEVTLTPLVVSIFKNNSLYNGNRSDYLASHYNFANVGAVFTFPTSEGKMMKAYQIGFGYNRTYNFNNQFSISGTSDHSSLLDEYVDNANKTSSLSDFNTGLAWNTWLMAYDSLSGRYWSPLEKHNLEQSKYVKTSGGIDELNFSFGGNYNNQFYFGATIGVPFLDYKEQGTFSEDNLEDTLTSIAGYTLHSNNSTEGVGVNLKLGFLYQPADFVRIGVAFHTPTYYGKLKNSYNYDINSLINDCNRTSESDNGWYNYKLTTPLRVHVDAAFFIQKRAFISAEYEYVNYALASLYTYGNDRYSFAEENQDIKDKYGAQHVIRIGGELTVSDFFFVRLGYNYRTSPYRDHINDGSAHTASAGIGFRSKGFFFDMTYQMKTTKESYWLYSPLFVNAAENQYFYHRIIATLGFKF